AVVVDSRADGMVSVAPRLGGGRLLQPPFDVRKIESGPDDLRQIIVRRALAVLRKIAVQIGLEIPAKNILGQRFEVRNHERVDDLCPSRLQIQNRLFGECLDLRVCGRRVDIRTKYADTRAAQAVAVKE